jgi:hypothetical protein
MLTRDPASATIGANNLFIEYASLGRVDDDIALLRAQGETAGVQWDVIRATRDPAVRPQAISEVEHDVAINQVAGFVILGLRDSAFAALARCIAQDPEQAEMIALPRFAELRGDPRYAAALRALHM